MGYLLILTSVLNILGKYINQFIMDFILRRVFVQCNHNILYKYLYGSIDVSFVFTNLIPQSWFTIPNEREFAFAYRIPNVLYKIFCMCATNEIVEPCG